MSGSRQVKAAETAAALKAASRQLFVERGYLNTKISDITAAAGRAAGSFYNHFASKEDLLEALATDVAADAGGLIANHGGYHDLSDPVVLRDHIAVFWRIYTTRYAEIDALRQAALVDAGIASVLRRLRAEQIQPWIEHLHDMRTRDVPLAGDPDVLAAAMIALLEGFCRTWLTEPDPVPADRAIDTLTALIAHGIRGDMC